MSITYTVEKKENALIIHSALEIRYYQKFQHFISMPFSKILHLLDSETGAPLNIS